MDNWKKTTGTVEHMEIKIWKRNLKNVYDWLESVNLLSLLKKGDIFKAE